MKTKDLKGQKLEDFRKKVDEITLVLKIAETNEGQGL